MSLFALVAYFFIILSQVSNKDIRIQADHDAPAFLRIASSISSMLTALVELIIPFKQEMSCEDATTSYRPSVSFISSSRSPGPTWRSVLTGAGMVICPLLVMVAVVMF